MMFSRKYMLVFLMIGNCFLCLFAMKDAARENNKAKRSSSEWDMVGCDENRVVFLEQTWIESLQKLADNKSIETMPFYSQREATNDFVAKIKVYREQKSNKGLKISDPTEMLTFLKSNVVKSLFIIKGTEKDKKENHPLIISEHTKAILPDFGSKRTKIAIPESDDDCMFVMEL